MPSRIRVGLGGQPGTATSTGMQFETRPQGPASSLLRVTTYFEPRGLAGNLYWHMLYPVHTFIFRGLTAEISRRAQALPRPAA